MAYIDDRIWCHPKIVGLSDKAFRVWVSSIAYSSGMSTLGVLDFSQQKLLGGTKKTQQELIAAKLWDGPALNGDILIHDWHEYNSQRDEQRAQARDRKRRQRDKQRDTRVTNDVTNSVTSRAGAGASREGVKSEGVKSEGSQERKAVPKTSSSAHPESLTAQPFVAFLVDESTRLGAPLDARSKGHAAKIIAGLVAAGATDETLRTGITRMIERGRPISALADIVREVAVAPAAEPEVDYPLLPPVAYDWVEPR